MPVLSVNRRTMLKRLSAAAAGTAAVGGTASVERELVEIDGEQYLARVDMDVDVEDVDLEADEIDSPETCYGPCYSFCDFCYA